tara:strand:+ start:1260 stop:1586 length:327 start_codon:yes stop_codon:yes gene_type:complete
MSYTKSDLQLSESCLLNAILELGKILKEKHPEVSTKLLFNFNTYNKIQLSDMMTSFQCLFVKSIDSPLGILDIDSLIENHVESVKDIINNVLCESVMRKPVLKRTPIG